MPKTPPKSKGLSKEIQSALSLPRPPFEMTDVLEIEDMNCRMFMPAPEMSKWMRAALIDEGGPIANPDHWHLRMARIGVLWTNVPMKRNMVPIAGQAEIFMPQGNKWAMERQKYQVQNWFGRLPDFIITLYAPLFDVIEDAACCAICDHELYHCSYKRDEFGAPKFSKKTGKPLYAILGHDVEEFTGVTRRWGVGFSAGQTAKLVQFANLPPEITAAQIECACGNCAAKM